MKTLEKLILLTGMALGCTNNQSTLQELEVTNPPNTYFTGNTDNIAMFQISASSQKPLKRASYFLDGKEYSMGIKVDEKGRYFAVGNELLTPSSLEEGEHSLEIRCIADDGTSLTRKSTFIVDNTKPRIKVGVKDGKFRVRVSDNFEVIYSLFAIDKKNNMRKINDYEIVKKNRREVELTLNTNQLSNNESLLVLASDPAGNYGVNE